MAPGPVQGLFTYSVPETMFDTAIPGMRVVVPFGSRVIIGLVARRVSSSEVKTKPIIEVVDDSIVASPELIDLTLWTANHYFASPGEVLATILPRDDIKIDTLLRFRPGAVPPSPEREGDALLYSVLAEKGGQRRFDQLTKDLGLNRTALTKLLRTSSVKEFVVQSRSARKVTIRRKKRAVAEEAPLCDGLVPLTAEQERVFSRVAHDLGKGLFAPHLIHGITGSGKTEVYAHLASRALAAGLQVLILAPETALADALVTRMTRRFGFRPVAIHSDMTPRERYFAWEACLNGVAQLVVGARSAVYAPLEKLGLIIVDEEHDPSYKQDSQPRYNGRDVAIKRAFMEKIPVVLGSATPSMESYYNALSGKYRLSELKERIDKRPLPKVSLIRPEVPASVGEELRAELAKRLDEGEQSLLFINRRGAARFLQCSRCGHVFECPNCSLNLVFHKSEKRLRCHTCGFDTLSPEYCPDCKSSEIFMGGAGSEKIELEIATLFPGARLARMDRDSTTKRGSGSTILRSMANLDVDILIGTQMVAKGHDFPNVTLVGAVSADEGLGVPDFRAGERTFQVITQVAGRAGRGERPGTVIVQAVNFFHHSLQSAAGHDFARFYEQEILLREMALYPPFVRLALMRISAPTRAQGEAFAEIAQRALLRAVRETEGLVGLGPAEASVFKVRNRYRWNALFKASNHRVLAAGVRRFLDLAEILNGRRQGGITVTVDMDPVNML